MVDAEMTPRERVIAAIAGAAVDRPPVSLWRHFPERDQTAADLTAVTVEWQRRYGFDLVKYMPPGDYPTIDWGATSRYEGSPGGTRTTLKFPVTQPADWPKLSMLDVEHGFNGVILDAVLQTRAALPSHVPLLHTVFSPLTIAMKLSQGKAIDHLREHPAELHAGLYTITNVTAAMAQSSIERGADGLFFATQCADFSLLTEAEYREFGLNYDLQVLNVLSSETINILHLHGEQPMFGLQKHYPIQIVNWHDRHAAPALSEGISQSGRCVAGGINERTIATMTSTEAAHEATDAIAVTGGQHLIVAPGCVIPVATPEANIEAVAAAVRAAAEN